MKMRDKFGGRPFTPQVEWMPTEESAIDAVAQDAMHGPDGLLEQRRGHEGRYDLEAPAGFRPKD